MENKENKFEQRLCLVDRSSLSILGVQKVISAKPDLVQALLLDSGVMISGTDLQVSKLDLDAKLLELSGKIDSIRYTVGKRDNFFKRIFK